MNLLKTRLTNKDLHKLLHLVSEHSGENDEECQGDIPGDGDVAGELRLLLGEGAGRGIPGGGGVPELVVPEVRDGDEHHVREHQRHADIVENHSVQESIMTRFKNLSGQENKNQRRIKCFSPDHI